MTSIKQHLYNYVYKVVLTQEIKIHVRIDLYKYKQSLGMQI